MLPVCNTEESVLSSTPVTPVILYAAATLITSIQRKRLSGLQTQAVERKTNSILLDPSHPLHGCFELLPSGRRYRVPLAKSFTPKADTHTTSFLHKHHVHTIRENRLPSIKDNVF